MGRPSRAGGAAATILPNRRERGKKNGRSERIRTSGPRLPKTVLYQAELHPDVSITSIDHKVDHAAHGFFIGGLVNLVQTL